MYAAEKGCLDFDAEAFVDYYERQGWVLKNGRPMKCWKSAVRLWIRTSEPKNGASRPVTFNEARVQGTLEAAEEFLRGSGVLDGTVKRSGVPRRIETKRGF